MEDRRQIVLVLIAAKASQIVVADECDATLDGIP